MSYTPKTYDPNYMVKFLHNFPHLGGSTTFNQYSKNYQTSLAILGLVSLCVFSAMFGFLWHKFHMKKPRKSFLRVMDRTTLRICMIVCSLAVIGLSIAGGIFAWGKSVKGLDGVVDDIDALNKIADNSLLLSQYVVLGADQLLGALVKYSTNCTALNDIYPPFNASFSAAVDEYQHDSFVLADLFNKAKPKIDSGVKYLQFSLLVMVILVVSVCFTDMLVAITNLPRVHRISRSLVLTTLIICGLVVTVQFTASVAAGDFCYHADDNGVKLVGDYAGKNSTTYEIAQFYSKCEVQNPTAVKMYEIIAQLEDLQAQLNAVYPCNLTRQARQDLNSRVSTCIDLSGAVILLTKCEALNPNWASLLHTHLCDDFLVGIGWLWIDHVTCCIFATAISVMGFDLLLTFRTSWLFGKSFRPREQESLVVPSGAVVGGGEGEGESGHVTVVGKYGSGRSVVPGYT